MIFPCYAAALTILKYHTQLGTFKVQRENGTVIKFPKFETNNNKTPRTITFEVQDTIKRFLLKMKEELLFMTIKKNSPQEFEI